MDFTPVSALIGGSLIGIASAFLLYFNGRIAGISGFLGRGLFFRRGDAWRWLFVAGLVLGGAVGMAASGFKPDATYGSLPLIAIGGLFVGFGTRMSNGCTSGHGVCGNARLSPRSIAATITFIAVGMMTTFAVLHAGGVA